MLIWQPFCGPEVIISIYRWANWGSKWWSGISHSFTHSLTFIMCLLCARFLNLASVPQPILVEQKFKSQAAHLQVKRTLPLCAAAQMISNKNFSQFLVSKKHVRKPHIFTVGQQLYYFMYNNWHLINVVNEQMGGWVLRVTMVLLFLSPGTLIRAKWDHGKRVLARDCFNILFNILFFFFF